MNAAAVLCPGPSLVAYPGPAAYTPGCRVAVNRAAGRVASDFWICLDAHTFRWVQEDFGGPVGSPVLVCEHSARNAIVSEYPSAAEMVHLSVREIFPGPIDGRVVWRPYGFAVAIVLAADLTAPPSGRPRRIDCWGIDWSGLADFDGFSHQSQKRGLDRWAKDRRTFDRLAELLAAEGVRLERRGVGARAASICAPEEVG